MRYLFLTCMLSFQVMTKAQQAVGDFNGDGRKDHAKKITVTEPYFEGGYIPRSSPGEYKISFPGSTIPDIHCGPVSPLPVIIPDYNHNKRDQLLLIGAQGEVPVGGPAVTLYEFDGKVMQPLISGRLLSTLQASHEEQKTIFTRNDSAWFVTDVSAMDSLVSSKVQARLIYPVVQNHAANIRPGHTLYTAYKVYINVPADTTVYEIDTVPRFKENKALTFKQYIDLHVKYPPEALEAGIEGTVYATIEIDTLGEITGVKIINKVHPALAHEAKRVYRSLPGLEPVLKNGKPVRIRVKDRIVFRIK